jgi:hypothetical protein
VGPFAKAGSRFDALAVDPVALSFLLEFVARRELVEREETLAGLVRGNPELKMVRSTAERLLTCFKNLHLMVKCTETQGESESIEPLTPACSHLTLNKYKRRIRND